MTVSAQQLAGMLVRPTAAAEQARQTVPRSEWPICKDPKCGEHLDPLWWSSGLHPTCCDPASLPPVPTQLALDPTPPAAPQDDPFPGKGDPAIEAAATAMFTTLAGPKTHPIKSELIDIIRWAAADLPRSKQVAVGPSEIGVDCMRRLAYRYAGAAACNDTADPWFSIVGTAVHEWLAVAIDNYNAKVLGPPNGTRSYDQRRYWVEERVTITSDQFGVSGSCDLYDADRQTPVDHKVVGATPLKKYISSGPSNQYRIQIHSYGLGHELAGRPVKDVAIAFYPRSGYLTDMHVWSEPYDRQIALDALARAATVQQMAQVLEPGLIPAVTDAAGCAWCPFYRPGGPADRTGCPGPLPTSPDATARR